MAVKELVVGLVGLQNPEWGEEFFPDDIPRDWRFGFVTNEVRALLLTPEDADALPEDLEDWEDEIDEGFHFLHPGDGRFAVFAEMLSQEGAITTTIDDANACWRPENPVAGGHVGIVRLDKDPTALELRQWVEQFLADAAEVDTAILLFDGPKAAYAVRDARVLVELMGY